MGSRTLDMFPSTYLYSHKFPNFFTDAVLLGKYKYLSIFSWEKKLKSESKNKSTRFAIHQKPSIHWIIKHKIRPLRVKKWMTAKGGKTLTEKDQIHRTTWRTSPKGRKWAIHSQISKCTYPFISPSAPCTWMELQKLVLFKYTDLISNCSVIVCHTLVTTEVYKLCPTKPTF